MRSAFLFVLLAGTLLAQSASAKTWVVDYDKSYLGFIAKQSDQTIKGRFDKFTSTINFDPADPQKGKIDTSVNVTSIVSDTADVKANLPTSDFFDSSKFPAARYTTTFIDNADQHNCYKADGNLTMKGITKEVILNFCLTPEGSGIRAKGEATLMRNDFGIGVGQWADDSLISNSVKVVMDIVAK